jgi:hypothetical protein
MALDVDGFAVFRSIGSHTEAFAAIAADVAKSARTLVVKQIAHKDTGLKAVRAIRAAVGPEAFGLIADGMSDAQIKSLAVKLDRHNPELRTANGAAQRLHVRALADGSAQPSEKQKGASRPVKAQKPPATPSPADRLHFSSAGAIRKR